jgi:hypothetical protein
MLISKSLIFLHLHAYRFQLRCGDKCSNGFPAIHAVLKQLDRGLLFIDVLDESIGVGEQPDRLAGDLKPREKGIWHLCLGA